MLTSWILFMSYGLWSQEKYFSKRDFIVHYAPMWSTFLIFLAHSIGSSVFQRIPPFSCRLIDFKNISLTLPFSARNVVHFHTLFLRLSDLVLTSPHPHFVSFMYTGRYLNRRLGMLVLCSWKRIKVRCIKKYITIIFIILCFIHKVGLQYKRRYKKQIISQS